MSKILAAHEVLTLAKEAGVDSALIQACTGMMEASLTMLGDASAKRLGVNLSYPAALTDEAFFVAFGPAQEGQPLPAVFEEHGFSADGNWE